MVIYHYLYDTTHLSLIAMVIYHYLYDTTHLSLINTVILYLSFTTHIYVPGHGLLEKSVLLNPDSFCKAKIIIIIRHY